MRMAKKAVDFAEKNNISLCRDKDAYFIEDKTTRQIVDSTFNNTAKSAIRMMKRYIDIPIELRN